MMFDLRKQSPFSWLVLLHAIIFVFAVVYLFRQPSLGRSGKEKIVIIPIDGMITLDRGVARSQSVESLLDTLRDLEKREDVKAVVLRINSPGGSVGAVQEIFGAIKRLKAKGKVVVSSFGDVAASGGYYVACAGDAIVSNPGTLTGSIGVIMQLPNVQGLLGKVGVSFQTLKSGNMKDSGSPFRAMTPEEKSYFTSVIMDAYDQFFQAVKEGRKMEDATLKPLADGRIFSGRMAREHKLVDELGGLDEAITLAKNLAKLENKNPDIVYHKEKHSLEKLMEILSRSPIEPLTTMTSTEARILYMLQ